MKTKPKWGSILVGWIKDFRLGPEDKKTLIELTSGKITEKLEMATRDFVLLRDSKDSEPHEAELREALLRLHDWTVQGRAVLPNRHEYIGTDRFWDALGWDPERLESFRCDLENVKSAAHCCLLDMRLRRGSPNKGAQQLLARDIAGILRTAGFSVTSARNGTFSKVLATLLNAAKDSKDVHSLIEHTVKQMKDPVLKIPRK